MKSLFRFVGLILKGIWKAITFIRLALTNLIFLLSIGIIYFIYGLCCVIRFRSRVALLRLIVSQYGKF
ncbi:hypothetical protein B4924_15090 [Vibrio cholerae]|nr:hypothetical protein [Vibrio cholerae]